MSRRVPVLTKEQGVIRCIWLFIIVLELLGNDRFDVRQCRAKIHETGVCGSVSAIECHVPDMVAAAAETFACCEG